MSDAFGHHIWATVRLIDACGALDEEQLEAETPGAYGSILDTTRHLVASDSSYLSTLTGRRRPTVDTSGMDLAGLRRVIESNGEAWDAYLAEGHDPGEVVVRRDEDGSEGRAPVGIRLAQAVHHGTDHRSQICTALTALGFEPPDIDVWEFALEDGRVVEVGPGS
jgi:uncharacterized damage-inducible protein DinB